MESETETLDTERDENEWRVLVRHGTLALPYKECWDVSNGKRTVCRLLSRDDAHYIARCVNHYRETVE